MKKCVLLLWAAAITLVAAQAAAFAQAPVVSSFSPTEGLPGTMVEIFGTNIMDATAVDFKGVPAIFTTILLDRLAARVPTNASTGPITVHTPSGSFTTADDFRVTVKTTMGPPVVTNVAPNSGWPGQSVHIQGENIADVSEVRFNGVPAFFFEDQSPGIQAVFATIPTNASTGPITISTPYGSCTSIESFTVTVHVYPVPSISSFSPLSGPPGTPVVIDETPNASNLWGMEPLLRRVTRVQFNGSDAKFGYNLFRFTAVVPPDATSGPIALTTPEGSSSSSNNFVVVSHARVTGFTPDHGPPGTVVELLGSNLDQVVSAFIGLGPLAFPMTRLGGTTFMVPTNALSGPVTISTAYIQQTTTNSFIVNRPYEIGLSGTCFVTNVVAPTVLTYTVTVANSGPEATTNLMLTNGLFRADNFIADSGVTTSNPGWFSGFGDSGIKVLGAMASQGQFSVTNETVRWEIGDLAGFATATLQISLQANRSGVIYQLGGVHSDQPDPDPRNNQLVSTTLVVASAQLVIRKLDDSSIEVMWPNVMNNLVLQSRLQFPGGEWSPVSGITYDAQGWTRMPQSIGPAARFYRLVGE
jgi:hypothetical protein